MGLWPCCELGELFRNAIYHRMSFVGDPARLRERAAVAAGDIGLGGFRIQARTEDLNRDWREIHREMLAILDPPSSISPHLGR